MRLRVKETPQSLILDPSLYSHRHSGSSSSLSCGIPSPAAETTMSDRQYVDGVSVHQDGLRDPMSHRCSPVAQPPATTYPDLTSPPYSVTTFNQPQHSEPHLLTPVSGVGSPSIQQTAKIMQQHPSTTASMYQSSPSSISRMCWPNPFEMSAPHSQAASPMPMNPATTESSFEMNYIQADTPIKDEIPEPPVPYFGAYGVSGQHESDGSLSPPMHSGFYMPQDPSVLDPASLMGTADLTMGHQSMGRPLAPSTHMPFHAPSNSNGYHLPLPDRDDLARRQSYPFAFPSTQINRQPTNRSRQPRVKRSPRMRNRSTEDCKAPTTPFVQPAPSRPAEACSDQLIIKDNCPPEERFLFQRRYELEEQKGGGIWTTIQENFNDRFQQQSDIPRLQMMVTRGRPHYLAWPSKDDEILSHALQFCEKQYFKMVYMKFKELGGGAAAHWGQGDVEQRAVELGWANMFYEPAPMEPSMNIRRRRKLNTRRRSAATDPQSFEPLPLTPEQREQIFEEILVERNIQPEDEEEEAPVNGLQQMQFAQQHRRLEIKAEEAQEGGVSGGRAAKNQKSSATKTKSKTRITKSRVPA
ncbi:hypothetical protein CSOJ01_00662 [Colletotrichum sojae]|uniref:Uncharacterized protein n=1 Tax=Colletotrichum sojae TaxID=2175907 RepID=A0A8H6N5X5_9PEZI|nr:hypothetical protein CSOJ01_00662 [Colletotrichum sojae]